MTDTAEIALPALWQRLVDIAVLPGQSTRERKQLWTDYVTANFYELAAAYVEQPATISAVLDGGWPHGLKRVAADLHNSVRSEMKRRQAVAKAGKIAELEQTLRVVDSLWDSLQDGHPPAGYASHDLLQSLRVPKGYRVTAAGVFRLSVDEENVDIMETLVAPAPIFPVARSTDLVTGQAERTLLWKTPLGWRRQSISREVMLDSTKLMGLAAYDAPVSSGRSRDVVDFLDAFEALNGSRLAAVNISHRMGWQPDGSFLLPEIFWPPTDADLDNVEFAPSEGFDVLAAAWTQQGTFEGWCEMAARVRSKPLMWVPLYAAVSSPLLKLLGVPGWITDMSGTTSSGKTTALVFAASACGKATLESPTVISSWDNTPVYIEQMAGCLQHLPLFLDETKRAKNARVVRDVIYNFAQGVGRGRGAKGGGARETLTWQTNMISTGESAAITFSNDAGTRARVIQIRGKPMGEFSRDSARAAELIRYDAAEHYGHVMPRFIDVVTKLASNQEAVKALRELHRERHETFSAMSDSGVARRLAAYIAVMSITADILHGSDWCEGIGVPRPTGYVGVFEVLIDSMRASTSEADLPLEALKEITSRAMASRSMLYTRMRQADEAPWGGWLGVFEPQGVDEAPTFALRSDICRAWLDEWGFNPSEVLDRWRERGWLDCGKASIVNQQWIGGVNMSVYRVSAAGWFKVQSVEDDEPSPEAEVALAAAGIRLPSSDNH